MRKRLVGMLLLFVMLFAVTGCGATEQPEKATSEQTQELPVFKIGAIPDQNSTELEKGMKDVANFLSAETGLTVEYVPVADYAALVTAFERGEIQLAWFGGLTGVQARSVSPESEAIVQRPRDEKFKSVFITQSDKPYASLEEVKGKTLTFGSESSTSGHLMPRHFMVEAGIDPDKDLNGAPNYSGNHDKTIKLVESGAFEVGALNISVWEKALKENTVDATKVKVFYTTPEYFDYQWSINGPSYVDSVYGEGTKANVKAALLKMGPAQADAMALFQTDKFIETKNENYKAIEDVARQLNLIK